MLGFYIFKWIYSQQTAEAICKCQHINETNITNSDSCFSQHTQCSSMYWRILCVLNFKFYLNDKKTTHTDTTKYLFLQVLKL